MKRNQKKLKLTAESIRNLTADQSALVRGGLQSAGGAGSPCDSVCSCSNPGPVGNSCGVKGDADVVKCSAGMSAPCPGPADNSCS